MSLNFTKYPVRKIGFVAQWRGLCLHVRSRLSKEGHFLNQTAALLWFISDGQIVGDELVAHIQSIYPADTGEIAADANQGLAVLEAKGLLSFFEQPQPVRPLIKVSFAGFGTDFFAGDNYFLWMLTHRFDVVLINPETDTPDLLFYRSPSRERFDHRRVDRTNTFKISVNADDQPPDFTACDYAFSPNFVAGQFALQHCQLPAWSFYLDWEVYAKSRTILNEQQLPSQFTPEQVCARLYDALYALSEVDTKEEIKLLVQTSDVHCSAPSVDAQSITPKKLTIGMATYDDFDGVYFTIQGIRLFHPEVAKDIEILIIDNHPEGDCAVSLQQLAKSISGCRYITHTEARGTSSRELIFRESQAEYVICVDSHVLLAPGSIAKLIAFWDEHPDCQDLLQGPLIYDDLTRISTHFESIWSDGMYGRWASDERGSHPDNAPFDIPMQGLGVFGCRKESWLGFNPRFSGFGGEEGYLHEKFRQAGRRTLCLPFLRWLHRFYRPFGASYHNSWEDRIRNYYIGFQELGLDTTPIDEHFQALFGVDAYELIRRQICEELVNPFFYFDAIYCINLDTEYDCWEAVKHRFSQLGIAHRVRRFSAVEKPESDYIGRAISHRKIIEQAFRQGFKNVLVFEDDALFIDNALQHLDHSIKELKTRSWNIFHLGGHKAGEQFPQAKDCQFLESPSKSLSCSYAIAYHQSIYEKILNDLPDDASSMTSSILANQGIDQYLRRLDERYVASPCVSYQSSSLSRKIDTNCQKFTM